MNPTRASPTARNCAQWIFFVRLILINDKNCVTILPACRLMESIPTMHRLFGNNGRSVNASRPSCECIIIFKWQQYTELRSTTSIKTQCEHWTCRKMQNYLALCIVALVYLCRQTMRNWVHVHSWRLPFARRIISLTSNAVTISTTCRNTLLQKTKSESPSSSSSSFIDKGGIRKRNANRPRRSAFFLFSVHWVM